MRHPCRSKVVSKRWGRHLTIEERRSVRVDTALHEVTGKHASYAAEKVYLKSWPRPLGAVPAGSIEMPPSKRGQCSRGVISQPFLSGFLFTAPLASALRSRLFRPSPAPALHTSRTTGAHYFSPGDACQALNFESSSCRGIKAHIKYEAWRCSACSAMQACAKQFSEYNIVLKTIRGQPAAWFCSSSLRMREPKMRRSSSSPRSFLGSTAISLGITSWWVCSWPPVEGSDGAPCTYIQRLQCKCCRHQGTQSGS